MTPTWLAPATPRPYWSNGRDTDYPPAKVLCLQQAAFLQRHADLIELELAPKDSGELARAAVLVYELFLETSALEAPLAVTINQTLRALATPTA